VKLADISGTKTRNTSRLKLMNLKLTVRQNILGGCIGASVTLRRVTSLELIYERMKRVFWLQNLTVFWLGSGNISLRYSMYMGLVVVGRQKYTQQSH